jgi:L-ribulose-5-phosphate 4-epimerase
MKFEAIREQVYQTVMKACNAGLIRLSAGNISARTEEGFVAITPTGIKYDVLRPDQIAIVDMDGKYVDAPFKPSSETPMHTAILRNMPEVGAVCHTHSLIAMTFASIGKEIPRITLELFTCGAPIPVAPWACPGTARGGEVTVEIFSKRPELKVCLLRNHGLIAIGKNLDNAFELAYDAEIGLQTYYQTMQIGTPQALSEEQVNEIKHAYA